MFDKNNKQKILLFVNGGILKRHFFPLKMVTQWYRKKFSSREMEPIRPVAWSFFQARTSTYDLET